jgi:hypothetical protein
MLEMGTETLVGLRVNCELFLSDLKKKLACVDDAY